MENIGKNDSFYSILKISQYPLPKDKIKKIYNHCDEVLVVEEGYPLVEEILHNYFDETTK
jgi:indolepyruvate ferredoxin oxidoreductase alpha subunit